MDNDDSHLVRTADITTRLFAILTQVCFNENKTNFDKSIFRPCVPAIEREFGIKFKQSLWDIYWFEGIAVSELVSHIYVLMSRKAIPLPKPLYKKEDRVYVPTRFGFSAERIYEIEPLYNSAGQFANYLYWVSNLRKQGGSIANVDFFRTRREAFLASLKK